MASEKNVLSPDPFGRASEEETGMGDTHGVSS